MSSPPDDVSWNYFFDVQREITRWANEQFPGRTDHQTLHKLVLHEVPELLTHKKEHGVEGIGTELADCFILLLDLASMWDVDIQEAIRTKMEINYQRTWAKDAHGIMQHVRAEPLVQLIEPKRVKGCPCPKCSRSNNIFLTPPNNLKSYVCYDCGEEFDDDIPF